MDVINNYIFAKYKDKEFSSYKRYLFVLNLNEINLYDKIDVYKVYCLILNYQIKKYGTPLCNAYGAMRNVKKSNQNARVRKYNRLKGGR